MNEIVKFLMGVGLALTTPRRRRTTRDRVLDRLDDLTDQAARGYETAVDRVERLYRTVRGEEDHSLQHAVTFLLGAGIGVGAAILVAPQSGAETRSNIAGKIHQFRQEVRDRVGRKAETA